MAKKNRTTTTAESANAEPATPQLEDLDLKLSDEAKIIAKHIAQAANSGDNQRAAELSRLLGRTVCAGE